MHRKRKKPYNKQVYRSLALVMQFGINMLVPICMMSALGIWLDNRLGTQFWMVILFFVGALAGAQNVYRMAKGIYHTPTGDNKEDDRRQADSGSREDSGYEDNRDTQEEE